MSASWSRESSEEDAPSKPGEYKLENFDLIKTIGTGKAEKLVGIKSNDNDLHY